MVRTNKVLFNALSGERVVSGLSQPHSLCTHDGKVYLANSETGDVLIFDEQFVLIEKIHVGGYLRGLAFSAGVLLVGVSNSRNVVAEEKGRAKIVAIDLISRQMRVAVEMPTREIYSILSFEGVDEYAGSLADLAYTSFAYLAGKVTGDVHSSSEAKVGKSGNTANLSTAVGTRSQVPALFLHTQKTAGTSIMMAAARHYGRHNVCSHGDFVGKTPDELARYAFVSGHFGFDFAKSLMVDRYSFTFLRSPIERVLSFYYFCRTRDPQEFPIYKIAQEHDLDSFLRLVHEHQVVRNSIWNGQTWRLSGGPGMPNVSADDLPPEQMLARSIENLDSFSFVGFTETFDDDVDVIMRGLRMPNALRPGRENVTHGRPLARDHSRQTIKLIEEMTELDQALYDAAWRRRRSH